MLGDVLHGGRPRCWASEQWNLASPWAIQAGRNVATFYWVIDGHGCLELEGRHVDVDLGPGDMLVVLPGREHTVYDQRNTTEAHTSLFELPDPEARRRISLSGTGPATRLVCGCLVFDEHQISPLLGSLPPWIRVPGVDGKPASPLVETVQMMMRESDPRQSGGEVIVDHLAQVLLLQAIRHWLTSAPEEDGNWFRALKDPDVLRALHLMHAKIDAPWTVAALADRVCLSRSAFATRFKTLVSKPPLQYLLECRMRRACDLLADGRRGIKEIAVQVGYTTAPAFSNAFKRWSGTTPGVYRRTLLMRPGRRASGDDR